MITLITGTPGSGKTLFAVTKILEYVKQNQKLLEQGKEPRMIYANIDGLNIDGVEPAPVDWRDTPDGSVIFYDEIQQLEPFQKTYPNPPKGKFSVFFLLHRLLPLLFGVGLT